jgi:hypothetical protein
VGRGQTTSILAGVLLALFLALPWLLMACRALGLPAWLYGAVPMDGWLRVWALAPVWLLLTAFAAVVYAAVPRRDDGSSIWRLK